MAIAKDATSTNSAAASTGVTWSHTVGSLTNGVLYAAIYTNDGTDLDSSATFNGVASTRVGSMAATQRHIAVHRWRNPSAGTSTLTISFAASLQTCAGAVSFSGVSQSDPDDAIVTEVGTHSTMTSTVASESGDVVLDFFGQNAASTATVTESDQSAIFGAERAAPFYLGCSTKAGAATVVVGWSGAFENFSHLAFNVNAAAESGGSKAHLQTTRRLLIGTA